MKKFCFRCENYHDKSHSHFKLIKNLKDTGFPTHEKNYPQAHKKANKAEKSVFGSKSFKDLETISRRLPKHSLEGKNTKSGEIEVSRKVPKKYRKEVAFHEKVENKILRKKK